VVADSGFGYLSTLDALTREGCRGTLAGPLVYIYGLKIRRSFIAPPVTGWEDGTVIAVSAPVSDQHAGRIGCPSLETFSALPRIHESSVKF